ncbi:hypothetical protein PR202_gb10620 [Eleusine coracana subsp. coracana]|uniref:Uncharacterized protein n=1 Tax=Eleusine coracana subsp. coracana TaxID=191504 RepID=A0AAV5EK88_ELECO|nr:hypothetical protein PR202_gb10620 [Eleusine coracana subsp. coracana]
MQERSVQAFGATIEFTVLPSRNRAASAMRSSKFVAAVLILVFLVAGGGAAARPVVREGGSDVALDRAVAAEFTGTDSSAQPSNCTYGNNIGGQCPPSVGH